MRDAGDLIASYGGSLPNELSDEHAPAELLQKMLGLEIVQAFRELKSIWHPDWGTSVVMPHDQRDPGDVRLLRSVERPEREQSEPEQRELAGDDQPVAAPEQAQPGPHAAPKSAADQGRPDPSRDGPHVSRAIGWLVMPSRSWRCRDAV
jgi:hypothetical protein